jgi:hypothetical protein
MRVAIGAGLGLFTLEALAGTLAFAWPNLSKGFGGVIEIGDLAKVKSDNAQLPISEGFPAYYAEARAYVVLKDPSQQRFITGEDTTGDGSALNVRALYQRCPHLGCKPNPCLKNFWMECPCHGPATTGSGSRPTARNTVRPRVGWIASRSAWTEVAYSISTPARSRSAHCPSLSASPDHPASHPDRLHLSRLPVTCSPRVRGDR